MKSLSLAQQLAQLSEPAPVDFDPEGLPDLERGPELGLEPEAELNARGTAAREHYVDVGPSALRSKLHESISDPKYEGVRVSRSQIEDDNEPASHIASEDDANDIPGRRADGEDRPVTTSEEDSDNSEDEDSHSEASRNEHIFPLATEIVKSSTTSEGDRSNAKEKDELSSTLKRAREEERKKGKAVARQLAMYDSVLDARIRLQKCVTSMNRLPVASSIPDFLSENASRDTADKLLSDSLALVHELSELQTRLLESNEGLRPPVPKRRRIDVEESERDWDDELLEASQYFSQLETSYHPYLLTTLQKWSNKVLAIAPSALLPANNTKFSAKNRNEVKSAVALVDEALFDRQKLVERTKLWRGKAARLNSEQVQDTADNAANNLNVEDIFDDTDFYQALLRDVIASRADGASFDLDASLDWRAAQRDKKRAKKASGAVDTRASKGRKLRFEVHEKLKNFMAPAPPPPLNVNVGMGGAVWHEAQVDELFASLLGKGFGGERDGDDLDANEAPAMDVDVDVALKSGFRVFG